MRTPRHDPATAREQLLESLEPALNQVKRLTLDAIESRPLGRKALGIGQRLLGAIAEPAPAPQAAPVAQPAPVPERPVERLPHTRVTTDAMPGFELLSEEYPDHEVPPLDRRECDESKLTWDQLHWRRYGYLVLPRFLPDSLINAYLDHRREQKVGLGGFENVCWRQTADSILGLGCYRPLSDKINELLGSDLALNFTLTQFTSTERKWHQDDYLGPANLYGRYCAVWMAMGDIHPDSGPFQFVPGSHRWRGLRRHLISEYLDPHVRGWQGLQGEGGHWAEIAESFTTPACEEEIRRQGLPLHQFIARKGDILIWHGKLMHRGSLAVRRGMERPALICHYYPADMKTTQVERYKGGGFYWPDKEG
ncbi:phytanoyl-CoA dioxygenase family protein [Myxococcaceae bacterium GXIMD 01537]